MAEQASGPPAAPRHDGVLQQRAAALETERADFIKLKQQLEAEFNQKRAKFKELYVAKEEELQRQTVVLEGAQLEMSSVLEQLSQARGEVETLRTVATLSESSRQEAVDQVRSQWQEEVASLQAIMKETVCEYEVQFHQRLEQERAQWNQYREAVERELGELRRRLAAGREEENLEDDMKKEDAEKLRSVVMPLEQEVNALKARLGRAEDRARELEASKVKELSHVLEAEKSCRTDLEMYVAVLNTQKSVLQEDAEKLRKELHEVCHKLELERQQHNQLKHTWQRANDQFLESQRLLMRDMQRIESVLSSEQLRQVEEMKRRDQLFPVLSDEASPCGGAAARSRAPVKPCFCEHCPEEEEEEEEEEERLSRVKQLQEEDEGDLTEPLEGSLLGLSIEEVGAERGRHDLTS
ncbi:rab GTPase-binding effector protein 1-like isoform X2 [Pseudoliparis swirei]|uniref:rab GTPase-binding effector protein 1-like isoform X2 n=1 Tax=Pseudoliparis swirei TaxID=2059687 RepID=UPI0024BD69E4|nr:rab GTPase-binding effector protein 1-like isoform X2 [Pseudoliparis swirei]